MRACWCTMGNTDACNNCHNNHDTMLASEKSLSDWLSPEECTAWDNAFDGIEKPSTKKVPIIKISAGFFWRNWTIGLVFSGSVMADYEKMLEIYIFPFYIFVFYRGENEQI